MSEVKSSQSQPTASGAAAAGAATSSESDSSAPKKTPTVFKNSGSTTGGVWESVVDAAVMNVSAFLSSTTTLFAEESEAATHMMTLLDESTVSDILHERLYNGLCGMFGCDAEPRDKSAMAMQRRQRAALKKDAAEKEKETEEPNYEEEEEEDDDDDSAAEEENAMALARLRDEENDANGDTAAAEDGEEEDDDGDWEASAGFRMWAKQRLRIKQLLRRKKRVQEDKKSLHGSNDGASAGKQRTAADAIARRIHTKPAYFCSSSCHTRFLRLAGRSQRSLVYGDPNVIRAIGALFPNLSVETLHRLAGSQGDAVGAIVEHPTPALAPGGVSETATQQPSQPTDATTTTPAAAAAIRNETHMLRAMKDMMWMMSRDRWIRGTQNAGADELPPPPPSSTTHRGASHFASLTTTVAPTGVSAATAVMKPRVVQGPLLALLPPPVAVLSFFESASTHRSRRVLRGWIIEALHSGPGSDSSQSPLMRDLVKHRESSVFSRLVLELLCSCDHALSEQQRRDASKGAEENEKEDSERGDELRVDPVHNQQRRSAFASQVFSLSVTEQLSFLLLFDMQLMRVALERYVLSRAAAAVVASHPHDRALFNGLLTHMSFPFTVSLGRLEEHLLAAMSFLFLAGIVDGNVRAEWLSDDNGLEDLLATLHVSEETLIAMIRPLICE